MLYCLWCCRFRYYDDVRLCVFAAACSDVFCCGYIVCCVGVRGCDDIVPVVTCYSCPYSCAAVIVCHRIHCVDVADVVVVVACCVSLCVYVLLLLLVVLVMQLLVLMCARLLSLLYAFLVILMSVLLLSLYALMSLLLWLCTDDRVYTILPPNGHNNRRDNTDITQVSTSHLRTT